MTAPPIAQAVAFNVSRQLQLTASLSKVDYAPGTISQQKAAIVDLRRQLEETEDKIGLLFSKTHSARKAAEASTTEPRKFTQFFNKKKTPERPKPEDVKAAYLSALHDEMAERAQETYLQESLKVAQGVLVEMSGKAAEYASLKAELRKVYNSIFDGPTIGFPEEDRQEHQLKAAKAACDRVEAALKVDTQVVESLDQALKSSLDCQERLKDALYWATAAIIVASERPVDSNEFLALRAARTLISTIDSSIQKARKGSANVAEVKLLKIGDDMFLPDNRFHIRVKNAQSEAQKMHSAIQAERDAAQARLSVSKAVADEAIQGVEACQDELDEIRGKIFKEIADRLAQNPEDFDIPESELGEAPPRYNRASTSSSVLNSRPSSSLRGKSPSRPLPQLSHMSFVPKPDFLDTPPVSAVDTHTPSFDSIRRSRSHSIVRGPRTPRPLPRPPLQSS